MKIPSDQLLRRDAWATVTRTLGFLEAEPVHAAQAFALCQKDVYWGTEPTIEVTALQGSLGDLLPHRLPLAGPARTRYLFVPTRSRWTAFFDNGHRERTLPAR